MKSLTVIAGIAGLFVVLLLSPIVGVLFGAFSGWVVGVVLPETSELFLQYLKLQSPPSEMWQIGALLGFVGSFFRNSVTSK